MASEDDDLRASDLLPPDNPPPDDAPKKIAERRVVGWFMADRLVSRLDRRPAGNSRTFWQRIEEDDPFIPVPVIRRLREDHTLYPADRIDRIPQASRPTPAPRPQAPPQPQRDAPPPRPKQRAELNPDPRAVTGPTTPRTPPRPEPMPQPPPEPIDRTPPAPSPPKKNRSGRIRVSSAAERPHGGSGMLRDTRSAAEIRAEKEEARKVEEPPAPPKLRKLDDVLGILGQLKAAQELHEKGLLDEGSVGADVADDAPRPTPKRVVGPDSPAPAPKPTPTPRPAPVDRTPPKPAASKPADPPASPPPSSGNLDDLFGGGPQEGRVRMTRSKPKDPGSEG